VETANFLSKKQLWSFVMKVASAEFKSTPSFLPVQEYSQKLAYKLCKIQCKTLTSYLKHFNLPKEKKNIEVLCFNKINNMQMKMLLNIPFSFGTGVSCAVLDLPDLCCEKKTTPVPQCLQ